MLNIIASMKTEVAVLRALLTLSRAKRSTTAVTVADLTKYVRESEREVEAALATLACDGLVLRRAETTSLSLAGLAVAVSAAARAKEETRRIKPSASVHAIAPRRTRAA